MLSRKITLFFSVLLAIQLIGTLSLNAQKKQSISGVYPQLAYYNDEGECGTGAVVPWNGDLWVITYGPHMPFGSSDKLYQITPKLKMTTRSESIGGTPADRLIHKESNQLFIGPYAIDAKGKVRVISNKEAPGRYTGAARHLSDPANKIYIATMEEGFYEVDVHTLQTKTLYTDGNVLRTENKIQGRSDMYNDFLPGAHGKGLYSGQGVLVYSNNGEDSPEALSRFDVESGVLAEWDGKDWKVIRRCQFTELTGPGGIYGNTNPATDPIWAVGFDYKSIVVGVRDAEKGWSFFRLPKASFTYDGAHGWNTEWPRIRNVGTDAKPDFLMTMHGLFWRFPQTFSASNTAGIEPRSAYLKVIGDFTRWNNQLVFGCDDSAQKEFLNTRKEKGGIEGPGQSNSNLWFTSFDKPDQLGPATAFGSVWLRESVTANQASEPYLFSGWNKRCAWIKNTGEQSVTFTFEVDKQGNNQWLNLKKVLVAPNSSAYVEFTPEEKGTWVRVVTNKNTSASVSFAYTTDDNRSNVADAMFNGISTIDAGKSLGGLLYGLGDNKRAMGILANNNDGEIGYYEIDENMNIVKKEDDKTASFIRTKFAIAKNVIEVEKGSVLIVDAKGRRWRLPLGDNAYKEPSLNGELRICREVATERDLLNCFGTFYELPAENADGFAKIRPISSHNLRVEDYASYRGLLIMTGIAKDMVGKNPHIFASKDKKVAVWAGTIDDLWNLGKPVGFGGPWVDTAVKANEVSDPYLISHYINRSLSLSHKGNETVNFRIEVDPTGDGTFVEYTRFAVKAGEKFNYTFPEGFQVRWIRFTTDKDVVATAWLDYK